MIFHVYTCRGGSFQVKSRHSKSILKGLISQFLTEQSNNLLGDCQTLYLNGGDYQLPAGLVVKISKERGEPVEISKVSWSLTAEVSDHKIFQFVRFWREDQPCQDVLIYSLDMDVKFLSIVFSVLFSDTKFIIKSQRAHHTYFYPDRVAEYMEMNFVAGGETQAESLYLHAKSLLTTYIMFGVDHNPGFREISHSQPCTRSCQSQKSSRVRDSSTTFSSAASH